MDWTDWTSRWRHNTTNLAWYVPFKTASRHFCCTLLCFQLVWIESHGSHPSVWSRDMQSKQFEYLFIFIHTVFLNCLNTFSETIAQFLKTLETNLKRVYHFVKTPQISFETKHCTQNHVLPSQNCFFSTKTRNTTIIWISLREHQLNTCVIHLKHFHQNTVIYVWT